MDLLITFGGKFLLKYKLEEILPTLPIKWANARIEHNSLLVKHGAGVRVAFHLA